MHPQPSIPPELSLPQRTVAHSGRRSIVPFAQCSNAYVCTASVLLQRHSLCLAGVLPVGEFLVIISISISIKINPDKPHSTALPCPARPHNLSSVSNRAASTSAGLARPDMMFGELFSGLLDLGSARCLGRSCDSVLLLPIMSRHGVLPASMLGMQ